MNTPLYADKKFQQQFTHKDANAVKAALYELDSNISNVNSLNLWIPKNSVATKAALVTTYSTPAKNWAAMVLADGYVYINDGLGALEANWVNSGQKQFPVDVVTNKHILFEDLNLSPSETSCVPYIKGIILRGLSGKYKISTIINTVDYPRRVIIVAENETGVIIDFGINQLTRVVSFENGTIECTIDWDGLAGKNFNNGSYVGSNLLISKKCYQSKVAQLDSASHFSITPTTPNPTQPTEVSNKDYVDNFYLFETNTITPGEKSCLPYIKNIIIKGTEKKYKLSTLLNTVGYPTRAIFSCEDESGIIIDFGGLETKIVTNGVISIECTIDWDGLAGKNFNNGSYVGSNLLISKKCYQSKDVINWGLSGINCYAIGDSITMLAGSWAFQIGTALKVNVINLGRGGSKWGDTPVIYDNTWGSWNHPFDFIQNDSYTKSFPPNGDNSLNILPADNGNITCASNQIRWMKKLISENGYPQPELIVFALGINGGVVDNYDEIMSVNSYVDLTSAQKQTFFGGLRFCVEWAMTDYPNCQIAIKSPLRTNYAWVRPTTQLRRDLIKKAADYYNLKFIDAYNECGIVERFEGGKDSMSYIGTDAAGRYLSDGLHPNPDGNKLDGKYTINEIKNKYHAK